MHGSRMLDFQETFGWASIIFVFLTYVCG